MELFAAVLPPVLQSALQAAGGSLADDHRTDYRRDGRCAKHEPRSGGGCGALRVGGVKKERDSHFVLTESPQ